MGATRVARGMQFDHTAIRVGDLQATAAFYEDALGFEREREVRGDDGSVHRYLRGEGGAALQVIHRPDGDDVDPAGLEHLAIRVANVDATFDRLVGETGCPVEQSPTTVEELDTRFAFVGDPDGYVVELFARTG